MGRACYHLCVGHICRRWYCEHGFRQRPCRHHLNCIVVTMTSAGSVTRVAYKEQIPSSRRLTNYVGTNWNLAVTKCAHLEGKRIAAHAFVPWHALVWPVFLGHLAVSTSFGAPTPRFLEIFQTLLVAQALPKPTGPKAPWHLLQVGACRTVRATFGPKIGSCSHRNIGFNVAQKDSDKTSAIELGACRFLPRCLSHG
jgi:hypothetical protein